MRKILATHKDLARKLQDLEKKYQAHDVQIKRVFDAIRELILAPPRNLRRPKSASHLRRAEAGWQIDRRLGGRRLYDLPSGMQNPASNRPPGKEDRATG
jgi:hypothetical protein